MEALWSLVVVLVAAGSVGAADDPLVGTFKLSGREGVRPLSGLAVIKEKDGGLVLSTTLGSLGAVELAGRREGTGGWRFESAAPTAGMTGVVGQTSTTTAAPALTLTILRAQAASKFTGTGVGADGRKSMTIELSRKRRALITYATGYGAENDAAFCNYGKTVRLYWRALGLEVDFVACSSWDGVLGALRTAGENGTPYARVLSVGHGGWDGPIYWGQIGPYATGKDRWPELVAAYKAGTVPESKMYASACHSGGCDRWETQKGDTDQRRWVEALARATGRMISGPCGATSTTFALRQVRAMEGVGTVQQETRFASAEGVKDVPAGGTPAACKTKSWAELDAAATPVAD